MKRKNIILVGSTGSIGKNLTKFLSTKKEYNIVILDRKSSDLKELANSLNLSYEFIDLKNQNQLNEIFSSICKDLNNNIHGLIFNSAQTTEGLMAKYNEIPSFDKFPMDIWDDGMQINVSSFYQICKIVAPLMFKNGHGKIIAVSSMYGVVSPTPSLYKNKKFHTPAIYSASKAALIGLVKWMASYFGEHNVNVNCISPGGVFNNQDEDFVKALESKIPLKRMADKDDINGIVSYLLSDDSNYANGHNFIIDGGYTIR